MDNLNKTNQSIEAVNNAKKNGFFGIGIFHSKIEVNLGTLLRSAKGLGADFVFTIGKRYKIQSSDTLSTWSDTPLYNYADFDDFYNSGIPYSTQLVGVELCEGSEMIREFEHPKRAIYLLGAEDHGLPPNVIDRCHKIVQLPTKHCFNVAVTGSLVMFDRVNKRY